MTPYIHVFVHHLWWFYKETDGTINDYEMEGSEKLNDTIKKHYSRNTNKQKPGASLFQTMEKQNRCELNRLKRPYTSNYDLVKISKYRKY